MKHFQKYANYYDTIYQGKNYQEEVDFLLRVIKKYSSLKGKTLLSLGCGTASHDILLAKKGYDILGLDASEKMLAIAKEKVVKEGVTITFKKADASRFRVSKKFDVAMAMFNIAGYMTENETMEGMLKSVSASLKKGGLFMFDCWYGPAVLKSRPENKEKEVAKGLVRKTTQTLNIEKSVLDIHFEMKQNGKSIAKENHPMRFWYAKELEYFLQKNGFKVVNMCNFMDMASQISEDNWNIFVIAKKA